MKDENNHRGRPSRRRFLRGVSSGTIASIVMSGSSSLLSEAAVAQDQSPKAGKRGPSVQLHRSRLAVLRKADVVVIGGAVAGVAAALQFARAGRKVVLVEHRIYLGREVSATLKPWVDLGKLAGSGQVPELIAAILKKQATAEAAGEIPLWMDAFKVTLENLLLEAGVELVYAALPTEAIVTAGAIRGVVIGNKSGRQALLGRLVLDSTSTAVVARVAGAEFAPETAADFHFVRMMEMEGVWPLEEATLEVPAELGVVGNKLTIHTGYRGNGHVLIECPMELRMGKLDLEGMMQREIEARHRTMRVAAHLVQSVAKFKDAKLAICAYELDGPQTTRLGGPAPAWAGEFKGLDVNFTDKNQAGVRLPLWSFAGPVKGLWCLNEAARLEDTRRDLLRDPVNAALAGAAFARTLIPKLDNGELPAADETGYGIPDYPPHGLEVKSQDSPQRGRFYERLTAAPVQVPVLRETDFLVVGGGTCGATCANSAAREGAKTVLLELCPGLGGTGTVGGVSAYWYGRYWAGFAIRNANLVDEVHKSIHWPTSANKRNGQWNIEAKMYALLKDAQQSHVDLFFNTITVAVVLQDNQVRGVVAATPYGPMAVLSKITADTTGDGDVPAFAGAKFTYGAARDSYPMWFNLAQYLQPTKSRWHFGHTVDVSNVDDYTRAILIGRRRGPTCHDHGNYIATRESRHIIGDVVLTLTDILRHRAWPDVINLGAGQMDCHRRVASNWIRAGLLMPILPTEMPYRALLPRGLENVLVGGKAFSGTHDVLYNLRNQPEMENLGGAMGVAAAYAIRDGVSARQVDLRKVQKRLTEVGTLLPEMLTRQVKDEPLDEAAIGTFAKQLDGRHLSAWEDVPMAREGSPHYREKIPFVEICTADPALAVPILEREMAAATGDRQLRLAQALAMFGSKAGAPVLIEAIERSIASGNAPPKPKLREDKDAGTVEHTGIGIPTPPADLVYSLGMTRDRRALAVWEKLGSLVKPVPGDFAAELPWPFHYVDAICYGAELLGDAEAVPILKKMHSQPLLNNQSAKKGFQIDFDLEKHALTEITLARTLARLGSTEGYDSLIEYLDDNRASLAEFAHMSLEELTGCNNGKDPQVWRQWLAGAKSSLKPIPLVDRLDG
ncbi:MAG: FAD-dependent oxidoreductase [Candidatus Solibacter sp.]|jgi:ribulose 1,5-bisphosphate synthetase/thiazole synthase